MVSCMIFALSLHRLSYDHIYFFILKNLHLIVNKLFIMFMPEYKSFIKLTTPQIQVQNSNMN